MPSRYHTGLLATPEEVQRLQLETLFPSASFIPDPTRRYFCNDTGSRWTFSCFEMRSDPQYFTPPPDMRPCVEVLIEASNTEEAINYLSLLRSGLLLALPNPWAHHCGLMHPIEYLGEGDLRLDSEPFWSQFSYEGRLNVGLFTLNAALGHGSFVYALEKYSFSLELDGATAHSTHPSYGQIFENTSPIARDHVRQLAAIIFAYSAIEELGLEIRASGL